MKGAEQIEQAKQKLESLPKTKTLEVKVEKKGDFSGPGLSRETNDKTIFPKSDTSGPEQFGHAVKQLPAPPVAAWSKMKGVFNSLRSGINDLAGGLKNVANYFLSSGGGALILIEGFKSLVSIGQHFCNSWIDGMKESAAMSERNAESIREAAEANEELRQKGDACLKQLEAYSSQESLSNSNKAEALKIIGELSKAYGDLGIKIDETTGKLTGVDSAMIRKAEKDRNHRIRELEAELKEIRSGNEQLAAIRDKAGIPVWFGGNYRIGGKADIEAAGKKIEENNRRAGEIRRRLNEERKKDPAEEIRRKRKSEIADLAMRNREQPRAFEQKKADDAFADARDPAEKIANRQSLLDRHGGFRKF